jgi:hypothetical protein
LILKIFRGSSAILQDLALFHRHHMMLRLVEVDGAGDVISEKEITGAFGDDQVGLGEGIHEQGPLLYYSRAFTRIQAEQPSSILILACGA